MKCQKSNIECSQCEDNPNCQIYSSHYVLKRQAKKALDNIDDLRIILISLTREG